MTFKLKTAPTSEPISLSEAKDHLRRDISEDDDYIVGLIRAARTWTEAFQKRALITQTWQLFLDEFPDGDTIVLPRPPLQSVTHVKYTPDDGTQTTFASAKYLVDTNSEPGRIRIDSDEDWPSDELEELNAVEIEFVAGYGAASDVPDNTIHGMKILISHWYEHREPVVIGSSIASMPLAAEALLSQHRMMMIP